MKYIIITGISSEDGKQGEEELRQLASAALGVNAEAIVPFITEYYMDDSRLDKYSELLIKAGSLYVKLAYGVNPEQLVEGGRDRLNDIWLYLNPFFHKTRNKIDAALQELLLQHPEATVIGHSLGSVIAVRVLKKDSDNALFKNPLLVTLGSPLWANPVRRLSGFKKGCQEFMTRWINLYSSKDPVAPLPIPLLTGVSPDRQINVGVGHALENYLVQYRKLMTLL